MKIENLTTICAGYPFRGRIESTPNGNACLLTMSDINLASGINWASTTLVDVSNTEHPAFLQPGDIVFVPRGTRFFAALVNEPPRGALAAPHLFVLRVADTRLLPGYLVWYLNHRRAQRYFTQHAKGTSIASITRRTLEDLPLVLPPLDTQQRISAIARCWQKEKTLQLKLLEKREEWLAAVLDRIIDEQTTTNN